MDSRARPELGVYLPQGLTEFDEISEVAHRAEMLGFHSLWLSDHMMPLMEERPLLEGWTALSAVATGTSLAKLGTIVMCNSFRHPSLLAKMSSTLDVISKGRLILGIGAGYNEKEYNAYGFPFPPASERIEQLSESLSILKLMWTEKSASFEGKYYTVRNAICEPKPVQKPHPPLLIGGRGKRISRVIAELGDYCNLDRLTVDEAKAFLSRLRTQCEEVGRSAGEVKASLCTDIYMGSTDDDFNRKIDSGYQKFMVMTEHAKNDNIGLYEDRFRPCPRDEYIGRRIHGTPSECIDQIADYAKSGISLFILVFPDITEPSSLREFHDRVIAYFKENEA
ncbi:MAG TPA: TIGR03560 family F420-dependent LLM class oxidoreductase, partial [Thermoproteota archaeon]|nr:TIGR03560 family F420-dependent LLM class oxidoreductase [Thermoproteota archaeon]